MFIYVMKCLLAPSRPADKRPGCGFNPGISEPRAHVSATLPTLIFPQATSGATSHLHSLFGSSAKTMEAAVSISLAIILHMVLNCWPSLREKFLRRLKLSTHTYIFLTNARREKMLTKAFVTY